MLLSLTDQVGNNVFCTIWTPVSRCVCVCLFQHPCNNLPLYMNMHIFTDAKALTAQLNVVAKKKHITYHVFLKRQNIFLYLYVPQPCLTGQCSCHIWWLDCASVFLWLTETSNLLLFQEATHLTIIVIFSHVMMWPWMFWMTPKGALSLNDSNCIIVVLLCVLISYLFITMLLSQITYFTSGISFDPL